MKLAPSTSISATSSPTRRTRWPGGFRYETELGADDAALIAASDTFFLGTTMASRAAMPHIAVGLRGIRAGVRCEHGVVADYPKQHVQQPGQPR